MSVSRDLWTCPECGNSERLPDALPERDAARKAAQLRHGDIHRREGRAAVPLHEALAEALRMIEPGHSLTTGEPLAVRTLVARIMVHPRDVERLRFEVARRGARVALCETLAVQPGTGLVLDPVAGLDRRASLR